MIQDGLTFWYGPLSVLKPICPGTPAQLRSFHLSLGASMELLNSSNPETGGSGSYLYTLCGSRPKRIGGSNL